MGRIFYLMGKSASGKDTMYRELLNLFPMKTLVLYTTRPMRSGEVEGKTYYYTDKKGFLALQEQGKVIEYRSYNTVHGEWIYATVDDGSIDLSGEADYLLIGAVLILALLMLVLSILYRREPAMLCYWGGTAVLVSSVLMLIPALYLQGTRWFDRFAVKEDAVFAAVTGYLYSMTGTVITAAIIGIVLAAAIYLLYGIVSHASPDRARREAKRNMRAAAEE